MNDFYRQMRLENSTEVKDSFAGIGITFSNNAEANIESLSSAHNANGSLYATIGNSKFDFWG